MDSLAQHFPLTDDNLDEPLLQRLTQLEMVYVELRRLGEPAPFIRDRMSLDPYTDLNIGPVRLAIIEDRLNTMPRKLHDWHSAHSVYTALCRNDR